MFELMDTHNQNAVIKVIGVGGGGGNAVNHMVESSIEGVDFICANTDAQALKHSNVKTILQLGAGITKGLGAGADPDVGKESALEDKDRIQDAWRPRFENVDRDRARASAVLLLNSPQDPTGAVCGLDCLRSALAFCREHELLLIHEIRWSEFGLTEDPIPGSILQLPGARECAVEISTPAAFSSLEKSRILYHHCCLTSQG